MTRRGLSIAAAMLLAAAIAMVVVVRVMTPGAPTCSVLTVPSPAPFPASPPTPSPTPSVAPSPTPSPSSSPTPSIATMTSVPTIPAAGRPTVVTLIPDGFSTKHVGHTADGRQFFLTNPFERSDFVALYLFDACGRLLEAPGNYMVFYEPWDSGLYDT